MRFLVGFSALVLVSCMSDRPCPGDPGATNYDTTPPEISQYMADRAVLVFSKTRDWRHNEGIAGADRFFADLTSETGRGFFTTENGAVFNANDLARFDLVVFNNMTGDALSPAQKNAFQVWLEDGGAWIGLHSAGDASHSAWPWYDRTLIGPEFIGHPADPQYQDARLVALNTDHPVMENIPDEWTFNDEWYSFDGAPQDYGLTPLVGLDETSYSPFNYAYGDVSDLRMGDDPVEHPVVWTGCAGKGAIVYSALGHKHTSYDSPVYRTLLMNAVNWVTDRSVCG